MHPSSLSPIPIPTPIPILLLLLLLLTPFLPPSHSYPQPLPLSTPLSTPPSTTQDPDPTASILQALNLFSHAVDTHNYTLFPSIFASDASANFNDGNGELVGLEGITRALEEGLRGKRSWHGLSTQVVEFDGASGDGNENGGKGVGARAKASSYLQGTFFGGGNLTGEIVTTYGRYVVEGLFLLCRVI